MVHHVISPDKNIQVVVAVLDGYNHLNNVVAKRYGSYKYYNKNMLWLHNTFILHFFQTSFYETS
jgi:hypothetical protein